MPRTLNFVFASALIGLVAAQTPGEYGDTHPKLQTWTCTKAGGCSEQATSVVLDALTHYIHSKDSGDVSCVSGSSPNPDVCPDEGTCATNCIIDGITDYAPYGVVTDGASLTLTQLRDDGTLASPRVYLLADGEEKYAMLQLTGNELTFDVDVSKLPCGMNGALYLSEMEEAGGQGDLNGAGAAYGTGYCDAQCFNTFAFINGVGNVDAKGACCNEMDIWEANSRATQIAPHSCNQEGLYLCSGDECSGSGVCDKNGCGQNPYSLGDQSYYGSAIDVTRPFTVVTQFPSDGDSLTEIRRLYVQDGNVIQNVAVNGSPATITDGGCPGGFESLGGLGSMGGALSRGMVLAMSVWWDEGGFMNWLDSGTAGPCSASEGDPNVIKQNQPDTSVTFSNIKWGEIDSTYTTTTTKRRYKPRHL